MKKIFHFCTLFFILIHFYTLIFQRARYTLEIEVGETVSSVQKIKLRSDLKVNLKQYDVILKEENQNTLVYDISSKEGVTILLEVLFDKLEQIKKRFHLENYSIRQRTLEEMFLNFTKSQRTDERQK